MTSERGQRNLDGLGGSSRVDLLSILVEPDTRRWSSDSSSFPGSDSHHLGVDGTRDAVVELVVKLWEGVLGVDRGLRDISDGGRLDHVSDGETLDGLVLWHTSRAVGATDRLGVSSTVLVSTVVSSLH